VPRLPGVRRLAILACAAVAGLGGPAGCGDDDAADPAAPPKGDTRSHAEYVARADRLCAATRRRAQAKLLRLVRSLARDGLSIGDAMRVNREGADAVRPTLRRVEALPRPTVKRKEVDAYLAAVRTTLEALDDAITAHERGDAAGRTRALARNRRNGPKILPAARRAGFKECGTEFGVNGFG